MGQARLFELFVFTRLTITDPNAIDAARPIFYNCWRRDAGAAEPYHILGLARTLDTVMNSLSSKDASTEGIKAMSTEHYKLHSYTSATGYRFILLTDPRVDTTKAQLLLKAIYELAFVETVCKDPLYTPYDPVATDAFKPRMESVINAHTHLLS